MPRTKRPDEAGKIYHAINRGNNRREIFHKPEDYEAFLRTLSEGLGKYPVDLFSFCLLPNHWHLVLRPRKDGAMGRLCGWISSTHTLRYHAHNGTRGHGHLYQGPFKSFEVEDDAHFLTLCRYVERNALRAKMVKHAEDWEYGSLHRWHHKCDCDPKLLSTWPMRRPPGWRNRVNTALTQDELDAVRICITRGRPFGSQEWIDETCERNGIWSTVRPRGRPRKKPKTEAVQSPPC
ncbi:transposase [Roseiconus lacunae]|uniref:Transposase n=1 Tax=Roseiconus lacunae TaxID=2605694 RepID=A0ABT7PIZ8_9BACT|nr:transposase [Roseiconus lacunae]MDM4016473.1 transposase [Roseiconus lacunae]